MKIFITYSSLKLTMLTNVKMLTIIDILKSIGMINIRSKSLKSRHVCVSPHFKQNLLHAQKNMKFTMLTQVEMPTIAGLLTFISWK